MEPENPTISVVYGDVCLRKQRRKRQKLLLIEMFFDFARNTTLHGLRYVTERGLSTLEKIFWLITFIASCGLCSYLINNVYIKWQTSPVIVSISENLIPVEMVPFPSVTICPQLKCKSSVYNYTNELAKYYAGDKSMDTDEEKKLEDVFLICERNNIMLSKKNPENNLNASLIDLFHEISPDFKDVFIQCIWQNKYIRCRKLFDKVITSEGVCYNINSLPAEDIFNMENIQTDYLLESTRKTKGWNHVSGYYDENEYNPYPRRGRENGASPDLEVILGEKIGENDEVCNGNNRGYKIYIQHPADLPQSSLYYYAALYNQTSSIALKFNMINTSETLRRYSPEERKCYFPGEKTLKYFKIYTAGNCRLECQSELSFRECGCVLFHMPHNDSRSICNGRSRGCPIYFQDKKSRQKNFLNRICQCLPPCLSVQYDAEILKTEYSILQRYKNLDNANITKFFKRHKGKLFSKIDIYFKEPQFLSMRRSELFGITDFLANCGGLLGLFLGFSVLSLVEIFYFITLRLWCTLKRDIQEEKTLKRKSEVTKKDLTEKKKDKNYFVGKHE